MKKPAWLKLTVKAPNSRYLEIKKLSQELNLATVCAEAHCPNIADCWGCGTATFMIMGSTCTRACRFCNVKHGRPSKLDSNEPKKLADTIAKLNLDYAVITCVDRDDLPDFGADHFSTCIKEIKKLCPTIKLEILAGDFRGEIPLIKKVLDARPDVFGHNIETVKRLQRPVRDIRASYEQSLRVLECSKKIAPHVRTKSSFMVGLGETPKEVVRTMQDLRKINVDFLTIGQYLRPAEWNLPVVEYVTPQRFEAYRKKGLQLGFSSVAAGPFVRSSYKAAQYFV